MSASQGSSKRPTLERIYGPRLAHLDWCKIRNSFRIEKVAQEGNTWVGVLGMKMPADGAEEHCPHCGGKLAKFLIEEEQERSDSLSSECSTREQQDRKLYTGI